MTAPGDGFARDRNRRADEVRVLVLTGLGLNCEVETGEGFRLTGATCDQVHLLDLLDKRGAARLDNYQILAFVGGFAFGDHLGAGFVFANKIRAHLWDPLLSFLDRGGLVLGICNGFQTLVRLGVLPGFDGDNRAARVTLAPNDRLGYRNAWVRLKADPSSPCLWTRGIDGLELPARHGEGKLLTDAETMGRLEEGHQVALRYVDSSGSPTECWPDNPNGSPGGVAGICDPSGRVLGLMPHPDAYLYPFHHPRWPAQQLRGALPPEGEGLKIFRNGVEAAREIA